MTQKTILIVEDDAMLLNILKQGFENAGYQAICAKDGEEALDAIYKKTPDVVLLDILLPKKDGYQVLQNIKSNPQTSKVPVIIISNLSAATDISRGKELGASEYFVKAGTSLDNLIATIKQYAR